MKIDISIIIIKEAISSSASKLWMQTTTKPPKITDCRLKCLPEPGFVTQNSLPRLTKPYWNKSMKTKKKSH